MDKVYIVIAYRLDKLAEYFDIPLSYHKTRAGADTQLEIEKAKKNFFTSDGHYGFDVKTEELND